MAYRTREFTVVSQPAEVTVVDPVWKQFVNLFEQGAQATSQALDAKARSIVSAARLSAGEIDLETNRIMAETRRIADEADVETAQLRAEYERMRLGATRAEITDKEARRSLDDLRDTISGGLPGFVARADTTELSRMVKDGDIFADPEIAGMFRGLAAQRFAREDRAAIMAVARDKAMRSEIDPSTQDDIDIMESIDVDGLIADHVAARRPGMDDETFAEYQRALVTPISQIASEAARRRAAAVLDDARSEAFHSLDNQIAESVAVGSGSVAGAALVRFREQADALRIPTGQADGAIDSMLEEAKRTIGSRIDYSGPIDGAFDADGWIDELVAALPRGQRERMAGRISEIRSDLHKSQRDAASRRVAADVSAMSKIVVDIGDMMDRRGLLRIGDQIAAGGGVREIGGAEFVSVYVDGKERMLTNDGIAVLRADIDQRVDDISRQVADMEGVRAIVNDPDGGDISGFDRKAVDAVWREWSTQFRSDPATAWYEWGKRSGGVWPDAAKAQFKELAERTSSPDAMAHAVLALRGVDASTGDAGFDRFVGQVEGGGELRMMFDATRELDAGTPAFDQRIRTLSLTTQYAPIADRVFYRSFAPNRGVGEGGQAVRNVVSDDEARATMASHLGMYSIDESTYRHLGAMFRFYVRDAVSRSHAGIAGGVAVEAGSDPSSEDGPHVEAAIGRMKDYFSRHYMAAPGWSAAIRLETFGIEKGDDEKADRLRAWSGELAEAAAIATGVEYAPAWGEATVSGDGKSVRVPFVPPSDSGLDPVVFEWPADADGYGRMAKEMDDGSWNPAFTGFGDLHDALSEELEAMGVRKRNRRWVRKW